MEEVRKMLVYLKLFCTWLSKWLLDLWLSDQWDDHVNTISNLFECIDRLGCDRVVFGLISTYANSSLHPTKVGSDSNPLLSVLDAYLSEEPSWSYGSCPASTLRIHNVAVWLLFGQVPFLRENYVATTYFRYVICKSLW
jgi:hypothetical protein